MVTIRRCNYVYKRKIISVIMETWKYLISNKKPTYSSFGELFFTYGHYVVQLEK